jgi:transposase
VGAQKKSLHASQRDTPRVQRQRRRFRQKVQAWNVRHFKFLDESSVHIGLTRLSGRAAPNQRVVDAAPLPSGPQTTTLAVVGLSGIRAPLGLSGAVNGQVFQTYLQQWVVPTLERGDILFLDNLAAHKGAGIETWIESRGARWIYLPPYSADLNPIEWVWSKVKAILRRLKARTFADLVDALRQALLAITPEDLRGWFAHCGYAIT